jgi:hypothetical protein
MGLDFNFDDIDLEQHVSENQLEIDLYDELITITDAEPDDQIRLLAARTLVGNHNADDKPESIRITGSLARVSPAIGAPALQGQIVARQDETFLTPPPPNGAKSQPLPSINPVSQETRPQVPPTHPPTVIGHKPQPIQTATPAPIPSPPRAETNPPPAVVEQPVPQPPRVARPPAPVPLPSKAAPVVPVTASGPRCQDCGQPAGELDMICIECGAFLG